jgi:hypothetical protein
VEEKRMYLASIFTEATSLMTTPTLYPPVICKRFCNVEVLPDPRKPQVLASVSDNVDKRV